MTEMDPTDLKCLTYSIQETARILGIGRDKCYEAARTGRIPVLQFGRLKRVPRVALHKMLADTVSGSSCGSSSVK